MGFNVVTYALILKYLNDSKTGLLRVQVSPDRKGIEFYKTDGSMLVISGDDWNAMTAEEQTKLSIITIFGNGKLVLHDNGEYKMVTIENNNDYLNVINKPKINSVELVGNKSLEDLGFSKVSKDGFYSSLIDLPHIPSKTSDLTNDTGFITEAVNSLRNYYRKIETYSNVEIDNKIDSMNLTSVEIVQELPTSDISENTIYLKVEAGNTFYTQWIYIEGSWVNVGSMEINMDNYYKISEIDQMLNNKVDSKVGYQLTQADFTTEEKEKLSQFENYVLKYATTNVLGVAVPDGKTILLNNGVISAPSGAGKFPPGNVLDIEVISNDRTLTIKWKDPNDLTVDGISLSRWKGTKLVYKADSFPKNYLDGILAVDNTLRNEYSENGFTITGLHNNETYYFQLFPYSDKMAYNQNVVNRFEGIPEKTISYKYMTAKIDTTNSAPAGSVTYEDDAAGMTPRSTDWDEWFGIYPCLLKDGVEVGKLNPNNFNQFEDGSPADIKTGESGDVMICFPRRGLKIANVGDFLEIRMTDNPDDPNFSYYAHEKDGTRKDKFYLGVYKAQIKNSALCSISGVIPTVSQTIDAFRNSAHLKGIGYEQNAFYQTTYRQAMGIMKYKTLNFGFAVGNGINAGTVPFRTGSADDKGMNYGVTNNINTTVKIFGLEDFFGDIYEYIDGITITSSGDIKTTTDLSKVRGEYPIDSGKYSNAANGYLKKVMGETTSGFIPKEVGASSTTYFSSYVFKAYASPAIAAYGGNPNEGITPNAYRISFYDPTISSNVRGARLMYL